MLSCVSGGGFIGSSFLEWCLDRKGTDPRSWAAEYFAHFERNCQYLVNFEHSLWTGWWDILVMVVAWLIFVGLIGLTFIPYGFPIAIFFRFVMQKINPDFENGSNSESIGSTWIPDNNAAGITLLIFFAIPIGLFLIRKYALWPKRAQLLRDLSYPACFVFAVLAGVYFWVWVFYTGWGDASVNEVNYTLNIVNGSILVLLFFLPEFLPGIFSNEKVRPMSIAFFILIWVFSAITIYRVFRVQVWGIPWDFTTWKIIASVGCLLVLANPMLETLKHSFWSRLYHWKLQRAFYRRTGLFSFGGHRMKDLADIKPMYVCSTSVNLWETKASDREVRSFDVFTITPKNCERLNRNDPPPMNFFESLTIADCMAISAAAVSYNMGSYTLSAWLPLMTMLGAGLGRWVCLGDFFAFRFFFSMTLIHSLIFFWLFVAVYQNDPSYILAMPIMFVLIYGILSVVPPKWDIHLSALPFVRLWRSSFNIPYREDNPPAYVYLSDGAHTDNLGLIPLLRHRCNRIVICDGGADPEMITWDFLRDMKLGREKFGCSFFLDHPNVIQAREFEVHFRRHFRLQQFDENNLRRCFRFYVRYDNGAVGALMYLKPRKLPACPSDLKTMFPVPTPIKAPTLLNRLLTSMHLRSKGEGPNGQEDKQQEEMRTGAEAQEAEAETGAAMKFEIVVEPVPLTQIPRVRLGGGGSGSDRVGNPRGSIARRLSAQLKDLSMDPERQRKILRRVSAAVMGVPSVEALQHDAKLTFDEHMQTVHDWRQMDLNKLQGGCCRCCNKLKCMGAICGEFPDHSTGNQFLTQTQYRAYHQQGYAAADDAGLWDSFLEPFPDYLKECIPLREVMAHDGGDDFLFGGGEFLPQEERVRTAMAEKPSRPVINAVSENDMSSASASVPVSGSETPNTNSSPLAMANGGMPYEMQDQHPEHVPAEKATQNTEAPFTNGESHHQPAQQHMPVHHVPKEVTL